MTLPYFPLTEAVLLNFQCLTVSNYIYHNFTRFRFHLCTRTFFPIHLARLSPRPSETIDFVDVSETDGPDNTFRPPDHVTRKRLTAAIYQTLETMFHRDIQTPRRKLKIRRATEYFWRNSRCLDSQWNIISSVWYIFSIETKTKE